MISTLITNTRLCQIENTRTLLNKIINLIIITIYISYSCQLVKSILQLHDLYEIPKLCVRLVSLHLNLFFWGMGDIKKTNKLTKKKNYFRRQNAVRGCGRRNILPDGRLRKRQRSVVTNTVSASVNIHLEPKLWSLQRFNPAVVTTVSVPGVY